MPRRTTSAASAQDKSSFGFIGIDGYKLIGYEASNGKDKLLMRADDEVTNTYPLLNSDHSVSNLINVNGWLFNSNDNDPIAHTYGNGPITITPVFAPVRTPFSVALTRTSGKISRFSWTEESSLYDYNLEISFDSSVVNGNVPSITRIDLSNLNIVCYANYYDGDIPTLVSGDVSLGHSLVWMSNNSAYALEANGGGYKEVRYPVSNGKVSIPLADFNPTISVGQEDTISPDFVQGIYNGISFIDFTARWADDEYCGCNADSQGEAYFPWKSNITIDPDAKFMYTAIYSADTFEPEITAIFAEATDTLPDDLLRTVAGIEDTDSLSSVWHGGIIKPAADSYSLTDGSSIDEIFPYKVTRASRGGNAGRAIKGRLDTTTYPEVPKGSGVLMFSKYQTIVIPAAQLDSTKVYILSYYSDLIYFDANGLTNDAPEATDDNTQTIRDYRHIDDEYSNPIYLSLRLEEETPDGWARVAYDNVDGYIYYGTNTSFEGRFDPGDGNIFVVGLMM